GTLESHLVKTLVHRHVIQIHAVVPTCRFRRVINPTCSSGFASLESNRYSGTCARKAFSASKRPFADVSSTGAFRISVTSRWSISVGSSSLMNELGVHGCGLPYLIRFRHQ